ncbi:multidrug effflux MFS transporter [Hoeflea poritis]|uniref:Bcr/CflA family efflux transporter n=1 Tax=Hoeflea poritis TaxID=2993659 RepID=A0ABT4VNT8_9HYPH|nr:multidrug effflux MFS transporter [Hoeflea poritis]MDA4845767.1 multidrug effflux MFS transporter [Hoeflea poritis]
MNQRWVVVFCGLLMSLSAFSTDITLPAFPDMVREFETPYSYVQWTVTVYIFSAGAGQLIWGSVSDRFGRKPTLFIGLSIFLAGQLLAVFAPTIELLLLARVVQGLAAAAAIVGNRAILRDLFSGKELARNMAMASAVFAIGPMLAPLIGAVIAQYSGWRMIFFAMTCLTAFLILMLSFMKETSNERDVHALRPSRIQSNLIALFSNAQSRFFLLTSMLAMAFLILLLTGAAPVYETEFGITGIQFALLFAVHGLGIIGGQILNRRLIHSIGVVPSVIVASSVMAVMTGIFLALTVGDLLTVFVLPILLALANGGFLVFYSNATSLVLDPHHDKAGFAVSIFGFTTQMGGAAIASVLVYFSNDNAFGMSSMMFSLAVLILVTLLGWHTRKQPVREV